MEYIISLLVILIAVESAYTESITVTDPFSPTCKSYYLASGEELNIHYNGENFNGECMIEVHASGTKELCVEAERMVINNECFVKVKYYKGSSWSSYPSRTYDCIEDSANKWCPAQSHIKIGVSRYGLGSTHGYNIHLKVTQIDSEFSELAETVLTTTYVVIISVIAAVVVITVIVIIVVCCVCNRRRATRGTVYQNAQPAPNPVPMGAYPTTTPYPQAGVYPQAGTGVYPQTGYQPPQPAGYHTDPNMEYKLDAVPPTGPVQPPPYSAT